MKQTVFIIERDGQKYKTCTNCKLELPLSNFGKQAYQRCGYECRCIACKKLYRQERKHEVLVHYSGGSKPFCVCCGEDTLEFLTIDHIAGSGNAHRKAIGVTAGVNFTCWLKRNKYPSGFQVLCYNCNCTRGFFGYCPHQKTK